MIIKVIAIAFVIVPYQWKLNALDRCSCNDELSHL